MADGERDRERGREELNGLIEVFKCSELPVDALRESLLKLPARERGKIFKSAGISSSSMNRIVYEHTGQNRVRYDNWESIYKKSILLGHETIPPPPCLSENVYVLEKPDEKTVIETYRKLKSPRSERLLREINAAFLAQYEEEMEQTGQGQKQEAKGEKS